MTRINLPGIVDLLTVEDVDAIASVAADARFDRRYEQRGPLLNRVIMGRVRSILRLDGMPLPPVAAHGTSRPLASQVETRAHLTEAVRKGIAGPDIEALGAYVRGDGDEADGGILAQRAVGRLFDPDYRADKESWSAAEVLRDAPSSFNPIKRVIWMLTGRVASARATLAARVGQDPTGLHATGVAIHNLVDGFRRMRAIYADPAERGQRSVASAVAASLVAPAQVLRQPLQAGTCPAGSFTEDTLVLLRLERANARHSGYRTAFMSESWSWCPAQDWVPALLEAVWREAIGRQSK